MAAKQRDYKAEYARRIERGLAKGLSRSQARGHPKSAETYVSGKAKEPVFDKRLEEGVRAMRKGESLTKAAKGANVTPEKLRDYVRDWNIGEKQKGRWKLTRDERAKQMLLYSEGRERTIWVRGEEASLIGRYMSAVGRFLRDAEKYADVLKPFEGQFVRDVHGNQFPLETDPNVLYRLSTVREQSFEDVYQIVQ